MGSAVSGGSAGFGVWASGVKVLMRVGKPQGMGSPFSGLFKKQGRGIIVSHRHPKPQNQSKRKRRIGNRKSSHAMLSGMLVKAILFSLMVVKVRWAMISCTRDPKPQTPNPKSQALNPKP